MAMSVLPLEQLSLDSETLFRDPAFMRNREMPIHRWVPWIAGFSGQFVEDVFREFLGHRRSHQRPLVLDPFAGVGTTLVQSMLHGFDTVGFEINPYAALAARTKLRAPTVDLAFLDKAINSIKRAPATWNGNGAPLRLRPTAFRSRIPFFGSRVETQVLRLLELIHGIKDPATADIARIALGAVMVSVSNYSYEPSLGTRIGAGKPLIEDADVAAVLAAKLHDIRNDVAWLQERMPQECSTARRELHCADFLSLDGQLEAGSVDVMVTSPPYMNNYHYVRNTRPQLFWLSLVAGSNDLRRLEETNFGKFWQTVRDSAPIALRCESQELKGVLSTLRKVRSSEGAYGGPGWANYVASYFNDCDRFLINLKQTLKRGGVGVVVIGNSIIQGMEIKTDRVLGDLAVQKGFKLEGIIELRSKRVGASITGSSVRRGKRSVARLYETAVVLRKR
jgi:hypothetical protein